MERAAPEDSEVEEEKTGGAAGVEKKLKRKKKGRRDGPVGGRDGPVGGGGSAERVSPRAPAGGTSSCLPSRRRFLLHFK